MEKHDFLVLRLDHQITAEDHEFMRRLDSKECEQYWEKDENGEKVILRPGWDKAHTEYNRIKGSKRKPENDLKVCDTTYSIE